MQAPLSMHIDIATLLIGMTVGMVTMAVALPAVMGRVNEAERRAQAGVMLQAAGWVLLLASGLVVPGSLFDRSLSTVAMAGLAGGLALNATAFDRWCGRAAHDRAPAIIAAILPVGYALGFSSYEFRVGWANGLLTLQMGCVAAALWRAPTVSVGPWRWLVVGSLIAQMGATASRGVLGAFFTESYATFLAPHPVNLGFALLANATTVLSMVAIVLAHREAVAREFELLATVDGLTGALNRRAWMAQATAELASGARYGHPVAVLMMDLDDFKAINDSSGHDAGDRALTFVAAALQKSVRPGDLIGRYGGEEFCVLMKHAELPAVIAFDARMRAHLVDTAAKELGVNLTYSAGIATRTGADDTLLAMLKRADNQLYGAKQQGRSRTHDADGKSVHDTVTRSSSSYAAIAAEAA